MHNMAVTSSLRSSSKEFKLPMLELVFKDTGQRITVDPSGKVKAQCAYKGFYHVKYML